MAVKPNKMGRIEAAPKEPKHIPWKGIGAILLGLALFATGIAGTLGYQNFIDGVKAQGAEEYKASECRAFTNEDKSAKWLECDEVRLENNQ